jgi:hypothetical protein
MAQELSTTNTYTQPAVPERVFDKIHLEELNIRRSKHPDGRYRWVVEGTVNLYTLDDKNNMVFAPSFASKRIYIDDIEATAANDPVLAQAFGAILVAIKTLVDA